MLNFTILLVGRMIAWLSHLTQRAMLQEYLRNVHKDCKILYNTSSPDPFFLRQNDAWIACHAGRASTSGQEPGLLKNHTRFPAKMRKTGNSIASDTFIEEFCYGHRV